jgi:putative ABC transport system permease protein
MNTLKVAWRSMTQRRLATVLTILSVAVGTALVIAIALLKAEAAEESKKATMGYELLVGAKGNPLDLVLSTMYHTDYPPGEIPYSYYVEIVRDDRVDSAIPLALEAHYKAYTLVGTIPAFFTQFEYRAGYKTSLAAGEVFSVDYEAPEVPDELLQTDQEGDPWPVIAGAEAARALKLELGRSFRARQGIHADAVELSKPSHRLKVMGILDETDTPFDRGLYVPLSVTQKLREFYGRQERIRRTNLGQPLDEAPAVEEAVEGPISTVTGVFVKGKSLDYTVGVATDVNRAQVAQAVFPADALRELFEKLGSVNNALMAIAFVVIVVAGIGILVSMYNSMNDRKHDIAVMRALGAQRTTVFKIIILEAVSIGVLGGLVGIVAGHGIIVAGAGQIAKLVHINITGVYFTPAELWLVVFLAALGAVAGMIPAKSAYDADIVTNLSQGL